MIEEQVAARAAATLHPIRWPLAAGWAWVGIGVVFEVESCLQSGLDLHEGHHLLASLKFLVESETLQSLRSRADTGLQSDLVSKRMLERVPDGVASSLGTEVSSPVERPLPAGYYVDNFRMILETVGERYADLLSPVERSFLTTFGDLSVAAQRLFVRLISRKGPFFRQDRLSYSEIPSVGEAVEELVAAGLADHGVEASEKELLPLLLRAELVVAATELVPEARPTAARKDRLMSLLLDQVDAPRLRQAIDQRIEVVQVLGQEQVLTFRLLFFGNLSQDWNELVLRDLGVVRYETYELRSDLRLFATRQALDDYLMLRGYRWAISAALAAGEVEPALEAAREVLELEERWHPSARRWADRIFNEVGRFLERRGDDAMALGFYQAAVAPPARERRARVMAKVGRVAEALALCEQIAADPRDETEVVFARRFAHRLRRMRGEPLRPQTRRRRPQNTLAVVKRDDTPVESLVLATFAAGGRRGFFAENWLWKTLFGLAFWDIVFAPIEGAFQHPFQTGPLDLSSPDFRRARADLVEGRLESLRSQQLPGPELLKVYGEKKGIANRLVAWTDELCDHLELALSRLEGPQLAWVFDRLSRDLRRYRRGFPDLFVLREEDPGFELYEVKAPGDQLRPEQTAWIDYLNEGGIPASILHVTWK